MSLSFTLLLGVSTTRDGTGAEEPFSTSTQILSDLPVREHPHSQEAYPLGTASQHAKNPVGR